MRRHSWILALALVACSGTGLEPLDDTGESPDRGEMLGLQVAPFNPTATAGEQLQFTARAYYEDTSFEDLTTEVTWVSTDERVATVDASGLATTHLPGSAHIVATGPDGVGARVSLTVKEEGLAIDAVSVNPSQLELVVNDSAELSAVARYEDGSEGNVSGSCAWSTADASVATVDRGEVRGVDVGETSVTATCSGIMSAPARITVSEEGFELPEADLRVSDFAAQVIGDDVTYTLTVHNDGNGYARAFWVDLFLDLDATPDASSTEDAWSWVPGLGAGDSTQVAIDVSDLSAGTRSSWVAVDREESVNESVRRNNTAGPVEVVVTETATPPQLRIAEFFAVTDGTETLYEFDLVNDGGATSATFWVDLFLDTEGDPEIGDYGDYNALIEGIDAGETLTLSFDVSEGPTSAWRSCALADVTDVVVESDETDNLSCVLVTP